MGFLDTVIGAAIGIVGTTGVNLYIRKADFKINSKEKAFGEYENLKLEYEKVLNFLEVNEGAPQFNPQKLRKVLAYIEHTKKVRELFLKYSDDYESMTEVNRLYEMNHNVISFLSVKERQHVFNNHRYLKEYIDEVAEGTYQGNKILYSYKYWDSYLFNMEERRKLLSGESINFSYFNQKLQRKEEITGILKKGREGVWYVYKK